MNTFAAVFFAIVATLSRANDPELVAYGPCLDDGSCPMPFGICVTETMECMGIDQPERFEEFEPRTAFDFEANPHILRYGPCLDDGSCPMPNGVCLTDIFECVGVGHLVKVEMEETDKVQESSNMTAALHFQEEILEMPKLDQMETRGAFSLKTEL